MQRLLPSPIHGSRQYKLWDSRGLHIGKQRFQISGYKGELKIGIQLGVRIKFTFSIKVDVNVANTKEKGRHGRNTTLV
jgi:hypothetical protein